LIKSDTQMNGFLLIMCLLGLGIPDIKKISDIISTSLTEIIKIGFILIVGITDHRILNRLVRNQIVCTVIYSFWWFYYRLLHLTI